MPRAQPTEPINILIKWYFLHSLKSPSTSPGSGPFPSCLEASSLVLMILLFVGFTV